MQSTIAEYVLKFTEYRSKGPANLELIRLDNRGSVAAVARGLGARRDTDGERLGCFALAELA